MICIIYYLYDIYYIYIYICHSCMFRHTVFLKTFLPKANAKQMPTFNVIFKNIYRINVDKIDKASKQKKIFVKLSVFCIYVHI